MGLLPSSRLSLSIFACICFSIVTRSISFSSTIREGTYKVWREPAAAYYMDYMNTSRGGVRRESPPHRSLNTKWIYYCRAKVRGAGKRGAGFGRTSNQKILVFASLDQVHECRAYLRQSTLGPTAFPTMNTGWYNSWYEKLPRGLVRKKNREQTLRMLQEILDRWETRSPSMIEASLTTSGKYNLETKTWYWERRKRNQRNNKRKTNWRRQKKCP